MEVTPIEETEQLYRRVENQPGNWISGSLGLIVTAAAFMDRSKRPSVDRALLCPDGAAHTRGPVGNGVVVLVAGEVRAGDQPAKENPPYHLDVVHRPVEGNHAHAQVESAPQVVNDKVFRRLRQMLAFLANQRPWVVVPGEV